MRVPHAPIQATVALIRGRKAFDFFSYGLLLSLLPQLEKERRTACPISKGCRFL